MILLSHPTGNQNSRQAAQAFNQADALCHFFTAAHFDAHGVLAGLLPRRIREELERRDFTDVAPASGIYSTAKLRELTRVLAGKAGWQALLHRESGWASVDQVYRAVDKAVAGRVTSDASIEAVYAYEDGALETFKAAKARGIRRIYELPIGYWRAHRRLCAEEAILQPSWAHTWGADKDSARKVQRKDEELALASQVIVPSRFVAESLREFPGDLPPISIIPYGCPPPISPESRSWFKGCSLRVLFVGGLSQRKGLSYLLTAIGSLGNEVSLTIIGAGPAQPLVDLRHRQLGAVPHSVVLEQMRQHDVLVFPSLFEGYALVIAEAMAQGMPVIITPNSGASDLVTHGAEGWIVPIRNSAAISQCLHECIEKPSTVALMGNAALELAASWTWEHYRQRLNEVVLCNSGGSTT